MKFDYPTYIVIDLPKNISKQILDIRIKHKDKFRSSLPAEITLTGSSGLGIISKKQNFDDVLKKVKTIADSKKAFKLSFSNVKRFEGSDVFYFDIKDKEELVNLHESFKNADIKYDSIATEYKPHCTLRSKSSITKEEEIDILNESIDEEFIVDTISVYMLDKLPIKKIFTCKLRG